MSIVKTFKYELIKIIIFLFLFAVSLFYVVSAQGEYYAPHGKQNPITADTVTVNTD